MKTLFIPQVQSTGILAELPLFAASMFSFISDRPQYPGNWVFLCKEKEIFLDSSI